MIKNLLHLLENFLNQAHTDVFFKDMSFHHVPMTSVWQKKVAILSLFSMFRKLAISVMFDSLQVDVQCGKDSWEVPDYSQCTESKTGV